MTSEELIQVMEKAKQLGVKDLTVDGVQIIFNEEHIPGSLSCAAFQSHNLATTEAAQSHSVPERKAEEIVEPLSVLDDMTDEEILYWSCDYGKELEALKLQERKQKEEEDALKENK